MTDETIRFVTVAIIAAIPPTLMSLASFMHSVKNGDKIDSVVKNVETIEKATNSMKDALVKQAGEIGHAQGKSDEKEEQAVRDAEKKI